MNSKQRLIITLSTLALVLIFGGVTYAFFTANGSNGESESSIITTGGIMTISYAEGDENISVSNIYPRDDAWLTKTITLTGTNTTELNMNYQLGISITSNGFTEGSLTYNLTNNNPTSGTPIRNITDGKINQSGEQYFGYGQFVNGSNVQHIYTLEIFLPEIGVNENASQEAAFRGKVIIKEAGTAADLPEPAPNGWDNAGTGTLLAGIKTNQSKPNKDDGAGMTAPGREIAESNEGLRTTEDDYGTSYYYRGAVENNYVVFAKMCWRIVRIDGQGNIKLVLYNYNSDKENVTNPCNVTGDSLAFARYDGDTYQGAFNTSYNKNTYIGYMYSNTPDSSNYLEAHANDQDSTILTNLKTWYDANFNDTQKNLLADTIWCNDKRLADKEYQAGPDTETNYLNTGIGAQKTAYAAAQRLVSDTGKEWTAKANATPTLKCGRTQEDNKISKFTAQDNKYGNSKLYTTEGGTTKYYKIGLLTADEIVYAGGVFYQDNSSSYLNKNANSSWWWTLSPYRFDGSIAGISYVLTIGSLLGGNVSVATRAVRPAVSLISMSRIASGGEGTAESPFVVVES